MGLWDLQREKSKGGAAGAARPGDRLVLVSCHGKQYVRESQRSSWRCRCGSAGVGNVVVILGRPGEPVAS